MVDDLEFGPILSPFAYGPRGALETCSLVVLEWPGAFHSALKKFPGGMDGLGVMRVERRRPKPLAVETQGLGSRSCIL